MEQSGRIKRWKEWDRKKSSGSFRRKVRRDRDLILKTLLNVDVDNSRTAPLQEKSRSPSPDKSRSPSPVLSSIPLAVDMREIITDYADSKELNLGFVWRSININIDGLPIYESANVLDDPV